MTWAEVQLNNGERVRGRLSETVYAKTPFLKIKSVTGSRMVSPAIVVSIMEIKEDSAKRVLPTMNEIKVVVADYYQIQDHILISRDRKADICRARSAAFVLGRECGYTFVHIGKAFRRDHGAVMHGIDSLKNWSLTDTKVSNELSDLRQRLNMTTPEPEK